MQYGVLFLLINSHSTQNTAVGKVMKLMSCPVSFSAIYQMSSHDFCFGERMEKSTLARDALKVTGLVQAVDKR
jgi:hypothetical protein